MVNELGNEGAAKERENDTITCEYLEPQSLLWSQACKTNPGRLSTNTLKVPGSQADSSHIKYTK